VRRNGVDERVVISANFAFTSSVQSFGRVECFVFIDILGVIAFSFQQDLNTFLEREVRGSEQLRNGYRVVLEEFQNLRVGGWSNNVDNVFMASVSKKLVLQLKRSFKQVHQQGSITELASTLASVLKGVRIFLRKFVGNGKKLLLRTGTKD